MLGRLRSHVTRGLGESGGSEDSCRGLQKVEVSAERIGTSTEVNAEDYGLEDLGAPKCALAPGLASGELCWG
jgi:hypothetical protein